MLQNFANTRQTPTRHALTPAIILARMLTRASNAPLVNAIATNLIRSGSLTRSQQRKETEKQLAEAESNIYALKAQNKPRRESKIKENVSKTLKCKRTTLTKVLKKDFID
ncbi:MAG: hypothetical protein EZS28_023739 [Streblomastix strix]|uniref:Uncharacterized protein n=1 Tax=Streblomastix strix TaxID=222440 RepID=A0A5J4VE20_9EUKA|nr:MAG: hypothetical protein EZS28_023739 [Streblomastix strix]